MGGSGSVRVGPESSGHGGQPSSQCHPYVHFHVPPSWPRPSHPSTRSDLSQHHSPWQKPWEVQTECRLQSTQLCISHSVFSLTKFF